MRSIFKLATCANFISLKCSYKEYWWNKKDIHLLTLKYPGIVFPEGQAWSLKQMGNLFCVDIIKKTKAKKILEIGAGFNLYFDRRFGESCEYWMLDKPGFYVGDVFDAARIRRNNTRFVESMLGEFSNDLSDNYFDLIFSVSVLEHVPSHKILDVCNDMFRLVRPGGFIAHSIDLHPNSTNRVGEKYFESFKKAGFIFDSKPKLEWRFDCSKKEQILLEPLSIIYTFHSGYSDDMWKTPKDIDFYCGTILVLAQKPK